MTIELRGVTVRYGDFVAVKGVDAAFPPGAVGLLGRNGAGKSSILKAMLGLVRPSAGEIRIRGIDAGSQDLDAIRRRVGYMPERDAHVPGASGFQMVALLGELSGLERRDAWRRAHEVLYLVGLEEQRYRPVASYSSGMRQKAKLAAALVHDPAILFLDEPTNGLDPGARADMLTLVRRLGGELGKSILLSTHVLQDVEAICDAVVVMEAGRVVAAGTGAALAGAGERGPLLGLEPPTASLAESLAPGSTLQKLQPGHFLLRLAHGADTTSVFAAARAAGARVVSLTPKRRSLTEVFVDAVQCGQTAEIAP
mgnify:CR=1 FL=1